MQSASDGLPPKPRCRTLLSDFKRGRRADFPGSLTRIFDDEVKRAPTPLAPSRQPARLGNRDFGREAAHKAEAPWQGHDDPAIRDRSKDRHFSSAPGYAPNGGKRSPRSAGARL